MRNKEKEVTSLMACFWSEWKWILKNISWMPRFNNFHVGTFKQSKRILLITCFSIASIKGFLFGSTVDRNTRKWDRKGSWYSGFLYTYYTLYTSSVNDLSNVIKYKMWELE
jgi:hypothetical protein